MNQKLKLIVAFIAVFALLSPIVFAGVDALRTVQKEVDSANREISKLISEAQRAADRLTRDYENGRIDESYYRSSVASLATTLVTTTNSISRETIQFAADLGIRVKCERIVVDVGFMQISVDPLIICDD
ncbi:MAG TPA: hypothetical protein DCE14_08060 [Kosmotogaceae bacterium]|nr:hypothetical protein [Kosmotogaceae bacterium]